MVAVNRTKFWFTANSAVLAVNRTNTSESWFTATITPPGNKLRLQLYIAIILDPLVSRGSADGWTD